MSRSAPPEVAVLLVGPGQVAVRWKVAELALLDLILESDAWPNQVQATDLSDLVEQFRRRVRDETFFREPSSPVDDLIWLAFWRGRVEGQLVAALAAVQAGLPATYDPTRDAVEVFFVRPIPDRYLHVPSPWWPDFGAFFDREEVSRQIGVVVEQASFHRTLMPELDDLLRMIEQRQEENHDVASSRPGLGNRR